MSGILENSPNPIPAYSKTTIACMPRSFTVTTTPSAVFVSGRSMPPGCKRRLRHAGRPGSVTRMLLSGITSSRTGHVPRSSDWFGKAPLLVQLLGQRRQLLVDRVHAPRAALVQQVDDRAFASGCSPNGGRQDQRPLDLERRR